MLSISYGSQKRSHHSSNVKSAYLAGQLEEEIYIVPSEGFDVQGRACRLVKSLYSLKQSARVWNHMLQDHVTVNGFEQLHSDHGLYYNGSVLIATYMDDLALARLWDMQAIKEVKKILHSAFDMKDLGECQQLLRMSINRELDGTLTISQQGYIETTLQEFGLRQCKPVSTLMEPG